MVFINTLLIKIVLLCLCLRVILRMLYFDIEILYSFVLPSHYSITSSWHPVVINLEASNQLYS